MAINLVLSQVVGQAFIVKPDGELIRAQPNTVINLGDVVSVPKGKNAWLITEEHEQVDVLDEALLLADAGFQGLVLPSDIADIIAAIEGGDDPTQQEGTETAAGETASGSALNSQVIIEGNSYQEESIIAGFDTSSLESAGLTNAQIDALGSARYGDLLDIAQSNQYTTPTFNGIDINAEADGVKITDNGDGTFSLIPAPNYNGDISFTVDITDGTTNFSGTVNVNVTAIEEIPEITLTPADLTEDQNVSEGSVVASISSRGGDGDALPVSITNDPNGYFRIEGDSVVLTEVGAAAIDDDILNLSEIAVTVNVSDGKTTVEESVTLPITPNDDDVTLEGDLSGSVTDGNGVVPATTSDQGDTLQANGQLTSKNVDGNDNSYIAETISTLRGEATIDEHGNWTYTTTDPSGAIQRLGEDDALTEIVTVRAEDGTEQQIVLTIGSINDQPIISGISSRDVYETNDVISVSGSINIDHPDLGESFIASGTYLGDFGSVTIDRTGNWTYTSDPAQSATLDTLSESERRIDTITVRSVDGTETELLVTIIGTNDPAQIAGDIIGTIVEADGTMTTSGQLTSIDVDGNNNIFTPQTIAGRWGELTIDANSNWTYTSDAANTASFDALDTGDTLQESITVYAQDGTPLPIHITIQGTDDLPVVRGAFGGILTDTTDGIAQKVSGTLPNSDVDADDNPSFENTTIEGKFGALDLKDEEWTYTLNKESAASLGAGKLETDIITLTASDGTQQSIVISVTGTDDAPYLRGDTIGSMSEVGKLTTSGTIDLFDPDVDDTPTLPNTTLVDEHGTLVLEDGEWTYTLNPDSVTYLAEGDTTTDVITITASDGTTHDITITITGTDQSPVLTGNTTGGFAGGSAVLTASGTVSIEDADDGDNPTLNVGDYAGQYGSLTLDTDGTWTYTLDPELAQYLDEGQTTTDTISITASDGTVHDIVLTITGSEDAAVLSSDTTGNVTDESGSLTTGGTLSVSDLDANDNPTLPDTTQQGQYGSFTMTDSQWTYTLDPELAESLGEGVTVTDTITITDSLGGEHELVISVTGTDDAATLTGDTTGKLVEGTDISTSGTVSLVDPDTGDDTTIENTIVDGQYGQLTLTDGEWAYSLHPDAALSLGVGESTEDTITLTDTRGVEHNIVITIEGSDDAAILSGDFEGVVSSQTGPTINVSNLFVLGDDADSDGETFSNAGQPSTLQFSNTGFTATITDSDSTLNSAAQGDTSQIINIDGIDYPITITGTVEYTDAYGNTYTMGVLSIGETAGGGFYGGGSESTTSLVKIEGPDILPGTELTLVNNSYQETSAISYLSIVDEVKVSDTISITDPDADDTPEFNDTQIEGTYGTLTLEDGVSPYSLDPVKAEVLSGSDYVNDTSTLTATDGTSQNVNISISGTNDDPFVVGTNSATITAGKALSDVAGSVNRHGSPNYQDIAANYAVNGAIVARGSLPLVDVDATVQPTFANTLVHGQYGTLVLGNGNWIYRLDQPSTSSLGDNDTVSEVITLTADNGYQTHINFTIGGSTNASSRASIAETSSALTDVIALDDITFTGTSGNNRIAGSSIDDVIIGGRGSDIVYGNLGNDFIDGGLGNDLTIGGQSNDLLTGESNSATLAFLRGNQGSEAEPAIDHIADFDTQQDTINLSDLMSVENTETLESYLSLIEDNEGHAVLNISTQGDGSIDQQVVFDNMSLDDMASAYAVDTLGMTTEQISASVIDAMVLQSRMIID